MNSKHVKRKVVNNYTMGQKFSNTAESQSSCSIFSVDEDVKFVVDDSENEEFPSSLPIDSNIELSRRTYSKKNPVTYPMISPPSKQGPFNSFPVFSEMTIKQFRTDKPEIKRKYNGKIESPIPRKIPKKIMKSKPRISNRVTKFEVLTSDVDSDVELLEEVINNPNALHLEPVNNLSSKKHNNPKFLNNIKPENFSESNKKSDMKYSIHKLVSKPYFIERELVVNEADIAPSMPNNHNIPNMQHEDAQRCLSEKLAGINGSSERKSIKKFSSKLVSRKELSIVTFDQEPSDRAKRNRELKSLYQNLNEISWTRGKEFKKLLQSPDLRHSDRAAGRNSGARKKIALKHGNINKPLKKSPTIQASLKKSKLAKAHKNKLTSINSNNRIKQVSENKVNNTAQLTKLSKLNKELKTSKLNDKFKSPKAFKANGGPKSKFDNINKKSVQLKNNKERTSPISGKSKSKEKIETKGKVNVLKDKAQIESKPKVEFSEAASSSKNPLYDNHYSNHAGFNLSTFGDNKDKTWEKISEQQNHYKMYEEYEKQVFNSVQGSSKCNNQIKPLEMRLWKNSCDELRKQFINDSLRKGYEKKDSNSFAAMVQELCDSYNVPSADDKTRKKKPEEETIRTSVRQLECAFRYKDICVRKHPNFMHIILVPSYSKKNNLSIEAIKELKEAFLLAKRDTKCRAVLISSGGTYFCTGIDLRYLIGPNKKQTCEEMAHNIQELVTVVASFKKPLIAAVNGKTCGFGVALLTYCDMVFASDKATFSIPSVTIGYLPEGGLTYTLTKIMGYLQASEMIFQGKRITASQALQRGLVTEVVWPTNLLNEVVPRVEALISQPIQAMEAAKMMLRYTCWDKLKHHMNFERQMLVNQWLQPVCQENIKKILKGNTDLD